MNWKDGYTMLHWAAQKDKPELCRYLIDMDADPSGRDAQRRTPLDFAEKHQASQALRILEEHVSHHRGSVHQGNGVGAALARASIRPSLSHGASQDSLEVHSNASSGPKPIPEGYLKVISQIDNLGWDKMEWARGFTLLHWASKNDRADLCAHFLFRKADPEHRDHQGKNAIDYASQHGSRAALELLQSSSPLEDPKLNIYEMPVSSAPRKSAFVDARVIESLIAKE